MNIEEVRDIYKTYKTKSKKENHENGHTVKIMIFSARVLNKNKSKSIKTNEIEIEKINDGFERDMRVLKRLLGR